jgi:hypothetical protein
VWDPSKNLYYRWAADEGCYVYQDSTKSLPQQPSSGYTSAGSALGSNDLSLNFSGLTINSGTTFHLVVTIVVGWLSYFASSFAPLLITGSSKHDWPEKLIESLAATQPSTYQSSGQAQPSYPPANQAYGPSKGAYAPVGHTYGPKPSSSYNQPTNYPGYGTLQTEPQDQIVDNELFQQGVRVRGKINGTEGDSERLDKSTLHPRLLCLSELTATDFYVRKNAGKFFRVGKVLEMFSASASESY